MKSPCLLFRASLSVSLFLSASVCSAGFDSGPTSPSDTSTRSEVPEVPQPGAGIGRKRRHPGPLRSFLRMAGISQKISPEEVLPLLARNVAVEGYQGRKDRTGRPTEFLILLKRMWDRPGNWSRWRARKASFESPIAIRPGLCSEFWATACGRLRQGCCLRDGRSRSVLSDHRFGISSCRTRANPAGRQAFCLSFCRHPVPLMFSPTIGPRRADRSHK